MSIICGLLSPESGDIDINTDRKAGYMLQKDHLFEWLTIFENACLGLKIQNQLTEDNKNHVRSLFKKYGLSGFENRRPSELSGGMRQRAALIRTLAVILWWNKMISDILQPYLVVLNSLPKTALAPIIIVWLGNNTKSIILIALLTSVIITIMTVLNGFLETDKDKMKLITILEGSKRQILTKVVIPSNVPVIFNALKINVGLSFVGVIVGEFLVGKAGLGYLIVYNSQVFKLNNVMMSVTVLALMAAVMYKIITLIENKYIKK